MTSYSSVGIRKSVNQDALCFLAAATSFGEVALAVICDGVGGLAAGELASAVVVRRFVQWFESEFPRYAEENADAGVVDLSGLNAEWLRVIRELNDGIRYYGEDNGITLATTFTGMLVCQGSCFIGHVGDCRIYRLRQGAMCQLTNDQTLVAREIARGNITEEEAKTHPKRHVILQAVGARASIFPEFRLVEFQADDLYMLSCDGLYRVLEDSAIRDVLSQLVYAGEDEMHAACERLAQSAIEAGSTDNITLLCFSRAELAMPTKREHYRMKDGGESTAVLSNSAAAGDADDSPTKVLFGSTPTHASGSSGDDTPTIMLGGMDAPTTMFDNEDAPTTVLPAAGDSNSIMAGRSNS